MSDMRKPLNMEELEKVVGGAWQDHLNEEERAYYQELVAKLDASITTPAEYYDWEAILAECNAFMFMAAMIAKYGDD